MGFNSKDTSTKQIVGAPLPKNEQTGNNKSALEKNSIIGKTSPISLSDEFLLFWGNNLDSAWFQGKRKISPFLIVIFLLIATILYLCFNLLFSPSEIEQIFFEGNNSKVEEPKQNNKSQKQFEKTPMVQKNIKNK